SERAGDKCPHDAADTDWLALIFSQSTPTDAHLRFFAGGKPLINANPAILIISSLSPWPLAFLLLKFNRTMRAIIIGAGRGRRLMPTTADTPKCFAEVGGKRLLDWTLGALMEAGVRDICFVGGY